MIKVTENNVFHLSTKRTSYIMRVLESGQLESLYYGRKIPECADYSFIYDKHGVGYSNSTFYSKETGVFSLDHIALEYSSYGKGDYRSPAISMTTPDGCFTTDFKFVKADVTNVKPTLNGLPSSYGESQTLTVVLEDKAIGVFLNLFYTVFEDADVISRSVRVVNSGKEKVTLTNIMSAQIDLPPADYTMVTFDGTWARERYKHEKKLSQGEFSVGSITGSSSNRHNPFFIIKKDSCTEETGECYGFNLVYSGNHIAKAEVSPHGILRVQNGINPFEFRWEIEPGDSFDAPESVMTYSAEGLNGMSHNMHHFVKENIVRGQWKYKERPVLVNNWEATYFFFNEKKIVSIAKAGKEIGAELFVLDDGWFGKRNSDKCSLGDWYVNKKKLPSGIEGLSKKINDLGLMFGLWVEPEMISRDSDLFRAHPDWAMQTSRYEPSEGRNQYYLDLTRRDVRDYVIDSMTDVFKMGNIEYIKWDMNRHFSDVFSLTENFNNGEYFHRYILGLYEILDVLTGRFPNILFESCSSGGNRFDLGMFCYMPQCWTSDNTDALDRIDIQSGTSYGYPQSVMTMHVSCSPSFACMRPASFEHRFNVAAFGLTGYEMDVTNLTPFEKAVAKKQIAYYKEHRKLLQFGEFTRIGDCFKDNKFSWQVTSEDKSESILGFFQNRLQPNGGQDIVKFASLSEDKIYDLKARVQGFNLRALGEVLNGTPLFTFDLEDGKVYDFIVDRFRLPTEKEEFTVSGAGLMYAGFRPKQCYALSGFNRETRLMLDNDSRLYYVKERKETK